jgi:hypothetical protein
MNSAANIIGRFILILLGCLERFQSSNIGLAEPGDHHQVRQPNF